MSADTLSRLDGSASVMLTGQGQDDQAVLAAGTGVVDSPDAWQATFDFLTWVGPAVAAAPRRRSRSALDALARLAVTPRRYRARTSRCRAMTHDR